MRSSSCSTLNVGAVILTPGLETMPGDIRPEYGYGRYPNVVTSLQFERMLSASGPFCGVVQRPSDGAHPRKVAWIQCVGSRDCTPWRERWTERGRLLLVGVLHVRHQRGHHRQRA